jgi:hypothetical protein
MDDRLHRFDVGVAEEGGKGRPDHRLAADFPVLLGQFAAGATTPSGCDNHSRNPASHKASLLCDPGTALAHVPTMCEPMAKAGGHAACFNLHPQTCSRGGLQSNYIAVQHLRLLWIWLNSMQKLGIA